MKLSERIRKTDFADLNAEHDAGTCDLCELAAEAEQLEAKLEKLEEDWEELVGSAYRDSELVKQLEAENKELKKLIFDLDDDNDVVLMNDYGAWTTSSPLQERIDALKEEEVDDEVGK